LIAECVAFICNDAGRGAAAVNVTGRNGVRIVLAPFGSRDVLTGPFVGVPHACAVEGEEAGVAVFHKERSAAGRRIIVVVLEYITERRDRLFVAVAEVMADDFDVRAVGIHAHREAADIYVAIVALCAGDRDGRPVK
jgi:hypothetical protein